MKHTWTLLLALLLALSLTACGGGEKQSNDQNGSVTTGPDDPAGTNDANGTNGADAAKDNKDNNVTNSAGAAADNNAINGSDTATDNRGTSNGTVPGDIDGDGDSLFGPDTDDGTAANNGTAGSAANSAMGGNAVPQSHGVSKPASFDQMVRNARVHDRDGILTDFENSVTPGSTHF